MKKMRKLLLTIISLVMVLVTFGGLTSSITAQEKEYTIGIDGTFAPCTYVAEAGESTGIIMKAGVCVRCEPIQRLQTLKN